MDSNLVNLEATVEVE